VAAVTIVTGGPGTDPYHADSGPISGGRQPVCRARDVTSADDPPHPENLARDRIVAEPIARPSDAR
jgi:hypothetical protein